MKTNMNPLLKAQVRYALVGFFAASVTYGSLFAVYSSALRATLTDEMLLTPEAYLDASSSSPGNCADQSDNDGDSLVDMFDPGCTAAAANEMADQVDPLVPTESSAAETLYGAAPCSESSVSVDAAIDAPLSSDAAPPYEIPAAASSEETVLLPEPSLEEPMEGAYEFSAAYVEPSIDEPYYEEYVPADETAGPGDVIMQEESSESAYYAPETEVE